MTKIKKTLGALFIIAIFSVAFTSCKAKKPVHCAAYGSIQKTNHGLN